MTDQTEPIRKSLLPCTPPPEWEFHTVLGARNEHSGVALLPGDTGPTVIRRRVTYGGWEPVRPGRWAPEPPTDARLAPSAAPAPATDLLRRTEAYLSALHGSVARHDNLAANLGCAGCELRDQVGAELRRMADEAQQQPKATPTVGYSGKGRVWCLRCPHPVDEDVPVTGREVSDWEICASCGRHVVDVARWVDERAAVSQPDEERTP